MGQIQAHLQVLLPILPVSAAGRQSYKVKAIPWQSSQMNKTSSGPSHGAVGFLVCTVAFRGVLTHLALVSGQVALLPHKLDKRQRHTARHRQGLRHVERRLALQLQGGAGRPGGRHQDRWVLGRLPAPDLFLTPK